MIKLMVFHKYGDELERRLRLQTFPVAVKMLYKGDNIPKGTKRPLRDFGYHTKICQNFALTRREGIIIASKFEDMNCPEAVVGYGLAKPPKFYFEGRHRFPQTVETLEAGSLWAHQFPQMEVGKYIGLVSAPLSSVNFEPDVIIIYCDTNQLRLLLLAVASKEGHELTGTLSAKGACVYSVVPVIQQGNFQVTLPCPGDARYAGAQHDEIIFSLPVGKIEQLLTSLRYLERWGYKLPFRYIMNPESSLPGNYTEMANMMGMHWVQGDEMEKYTE